MTDFSRRTRKKNYPILSICFFCLLAYLLASCHKKPQAIVPKAFNITTTPRTFTITPNMGKGVYPLAYNLDNPSASEIVAFVLNGKRVVNGSQLDVPVMGMQECQFHRTNNNIVGGQCEVDLAQLDSFESGDQEMVVIRYLTATTQEALQQMLNMASPPFYSIVLKKGGPHLIVVEEKKFHLNSVHTNGPEEQSRHVLQTQPGKKLQQNTSFTLTVNRGNELYALNSESQWQKKLKNKGLSCRLYEGVQGTLACKITNFSKFKNSGTVNFKLKTKRFEKSRNHLVSFGCYDCW